MKVYNKTSLIIGIVAILFFSINEVVSYNIALKEEISSSYQHDKLILKNLFTSQEKYLSVIAKVLASDSIILDAYEQNNHLLLQKHVSPIWQKLKSDKLLYEIHFFQPPAISFVNFSNFKSLGKDVSKVRTDILWVTSSFKESAHFLMCKTYAGYRVTEPIIDANGTMLGGLSLGKKVDWIPSVMKEKTEHDAFLVYYKDAAITLMPKYHKSFLTGKEAFREFLLADETINVSPDELQNINFEQAIQQITIQNENYRLFSYPIKDFNKQTMGYLCSVTKLETFKERFIDFSIKEVILVLLTSLFLLLINQHYNTKILMYITYIKDMTNRIKKRKFESLHNKDTYQNDLGIPALLEVEKNIVEMGLSLEKQYEVLENENQEKTQKLITQFYSDELTGFGSRNALLRDLQRYKYSYVALVNVRGFQIINDAFGFEAGNYILQELAMFYSNTIGSKYIVYRISNDEFAIVNKNSMQEEEFVVTIYDMVKQLDKRSFTFENIEIKVNVYAGLSTQSTRKLSTATIALRYSKEHRLESTLYTKEQDTQDVQAKNIEMISKISDALRENRIVPYFQPILNRNKDICKYEALVRMIDGEQVISPFFFLEISKKTKMYSEITKVMIEKTFECFESSEKLFSINITAKDILSEEIVALIYTKLETCANPKQVVFELVESDDLYNMKEIDIFLTNIKNRGAKIAIDDFGTGYSNFSYIISIKPDYLKIDASLIKNIHEDVSAYKTVQTIVNFAHNLDIKIVAEFIHSKEVFDVCFELGVDEFQGYYFGEPKAELL